MQSNFDEVRFCVPVIATLNRLKVADNSNLLPEQCKNNLFYRFLSNRPLAGVR